MTQVHDAVGTTHNGRRAPNAHSAAVQEAKRLEKMQTVCSSHRTSGTAQRPTAAPAKDAVP